MLYLCVVSGQVNHIIHASLLLAVATASLLLVQRIPTSLILPEQETGCGTVMDHSEKTFSPRQQQGKILFMSKCASCHILNRDATGPGLENFINKEPWTNRQNVYDWIRNPSAFMKKNEYARQLRIVYNGRLMPAFPDITNEEIDLIVEYTNQ